VEACELRHYFLREPSGPTLLKRRQLRKLGGWTLCSVPYWELNKLKADDDRKQYFTQLLDHAKGAASTADKVG